MRRISTVLAFALVLAACGTGGDASGNDGQPGLSTSTSQANDPSSTSSTTTANGSETPAVSSSTSSTTTAELPPLDGPPAPDFSLELADGSTFTLSEETRPVYMVFWAEW